MYRLGIFNFPAIWLSIIVNEVALQIKIFDINKKATKLTTHYFFLYANKHFTEVSYI